MPVNVSEDDAVNGRFGTYRDGNIGDERYVSYEKIYNNRFDILRIAYDRFKDACAEKGAGKTAKDLIGGELGIDVKWTAAIAAFG